MQKYNRGRFRSRNGANKVGPPYRSKQFGSSAPSTPTGQCQLWKLRKYNALARLSWLIFTSLRVKPDMSNTSSYRRRPIRGWFHGPDRADRDPGSATKCIPFALFGSDRVHTLSIKFVDRPPTGSAGNGLVDKIALCAGIATTPGRRGAVVAVAIRYPIPHARLAGPGWK